MTIPNRSRWFRVPALALGAAVALALAACGTTPDTFPNGNNATCWTKVDDDYVDTPACDDVTDTWAQDGDGWVWSRCDATGTTIYNMTYDDSQCQAFQPTLLNKGHGDTIALVYFGQGSSTYAAYPALVISCVYPDKEPEDALNVPWDFSGSGAELTINTLFADTDQCSAPIQVYVAYNGETVVEIGPDSERKVVSMAFTGYPTGDNIHFFDSVAEPSTDAPPEPPWEPTIEPTVAPGLLP